MSLTEVVKMPESIPSTDDDAQRAIQALSAKLNVPELKVLEVYKTEYRRLSAQSRIETFVSVLALRNTRSILQEARQVN
jgi:outer membrane protein assembly factor BamD (BamD/ComL family)